MRMLYVSLIVILAVALVGCGGGGGGSTIVDPGFNVALNVPTGTTSSASGSITATAKAEDDLPAVEGDAFIAATAVTPAPTTFNQAVTLTFTLDTAVPSGTNVALFSMAANGDITLFSSGVSLSADRKTATASVVSFPDNGILLILTLPS